MKKVSPSPLYCGVVVPHQQVYDVRDNIVDLYLFSKQVMLDGNVLIRIVMY